MLKFLRAIFKIFRYTPQALHEAVISNDITRIEHITTSFFRPDPFEFISYYRIWKMWEWDRKGEEFKGKATPETLFFLMTAGDYYYTHSAFYYFVKNNQAAAINTFFEEHRGYRFHPYIDHVLVHAKKTKQSQIIKMFLQVDVQHFTTRNINQMLCAAAVCDDAKLLSDIFIRFQQHYDLNAGWEEAVKAQAIAAMEALVSFPDFPRKILLSLSKSPLAYAIDVYKEVNIFSGASDFSLNFLIDHALNNHAFGTREAETGEIFFEKIDREEYIWKAVELKNLLRSALTCPRQADTLLTRFPTIFKPIAEILSRENNTPCLSGIGVSYRTSLGEVFEKHGLLSKLPTNTYKSNTEDRATENQPKQMEEEIKQTGRMGL